MTVATIPFPAAGTPPPAASGSAVPVLEPPFHDTAPADEILLSRVRAGDTSAFGELWARHRSAARAVAWRYGEIADPDDVVQEASRVMLGAILRGGGPFGDFRPYLAVTVRNAAISLARRHVAEPVGDAAEVAAYGHSSVGDSASSALDGIVMARAFKALPARWQEVLWYVCVEDLSTAAAGSILGLSPNATAALAKRARDGLRLAWLEAHLNDARFSAGCRERAVDYFSYIRGTLAPEKAARVARHIARCGSCAGLIVEIYASITGRPPRDAASSRTADRTAVEKPATSAAVVSHEHIQRTSMVSGTAAGAQS